MLSSCIDSCCVSFVAVSELFVFGTKIGFCREKMNLLDQHNLSPKTQSETLKSEQHKFDSNVTYMTFHIFYQLACLKKHKKVIKQ